MKRKLSLIAALALSAVCLTGCGIVTVVPIGEEASFTGQQEFDSSAESSGDWPRWRRRSPARPQTWWKC